MINVAISDTDNPVCYREAAIPSIIANAVKIQVGKMREKYRKPMTPEELERRIQHYSQQVDRGVPLDLDTP